MPFTKSSKITPTSGRGKVDSLAELATFIPIDQNENRRSLKRTHNSSDYDGKVKDTCTQSEHFEVTYASYIVPDSVSANESPRDSGKTSAFQRGYDASMIPETQEILIPKKSPNSLVFKRPEDKAINGRNKGSERKSRNIESYGDFAKLENDCTSTQNDSMSLISPKKFRQKTRMSPDCAEFCNTQNYLKRKGIRRPTKDVKDSSCEQSIDEFEPLPISDEETVEISPAGLARDSSLLSADFLATPDHLEGASQKKSNQKHSSSRSLKLRPKVLDCSVETQLDSQFLTAPTLVPESKQFDHSSLCFKKRSVLEDSQGTTFECTRKHSETTDFSNSSTDNVFVPTAHSSRTEKTKQKKSRKERSNGHLNSSTGDEDADLSLSIISAAKCCKTELDDEVNVDASTLDSQFLETPSISGDWVGINVKVELCHATLSEHSPAGNVEDDDSQRKQSSTSGQRSSSLSSSNHPCNVAESCLQSPLKNSFLKLEIVGEGHSDCDNPSQRSKKKKKRKHADMEKEGGYKTVLLDLRDSHKNCDDATIDSDIETNKHNLTESIVNPEKKSKKLKELVVDFETECIDIPKLKSKKRKKSKESDTCFQTESVVNPKIKSKKHEKSNKYVNYVETELVANSGVKSKKHKKLKEMDADFVVKSIANPVVKSKKRKKHRENGTDFGTESIVYHGKSKKQLISKADSIDTETLSEKHKKANERKKHKKLEFETRKPVKKSTSKTLKGSNSPSSLKKRKAKHADDICPERSTPDNFSTDGFDTDNHSTTCVSPEVAKTDTRTTRAKLPSNVRVTPLKSCILSNVDDSNEVCDKAKRSKGRRARIESSERLERNHTTHPTSETALLGTNNKKLSVPLRARSSSQATNLSARATPTSSALRPMNERVPSGIPANPDCLKVKKWVIDEDDLLMRNWSNFVTAVAGEPIDPADLLFKMHRPTHREVRIVNKYSLYDTLTIGLNRSRMQCYDHLKVLLKADQHEKGRLNGKQQAELVRLTGEHGHDWKKIGAIMNRSSASVKNHVRKMNEKPRQQNKGSWTAEEDDELLDAVRAVTGVQNLRLLNAQQRNALSWVDVAAHVTTRSRDQCWHRWHAALYHKVMGVTVRSLSLEESKELIDILFKMDINNANEIDWEAVRANFDEELPVYTLRERFKNVKRRVPDHLNKSWRELIAELKLMRLGANKSGRKRKSEADDI